MSARRPIWSATATYLRLGLAIALGAFGFAEIVLGIRAEGYARLVFGLVALDALVVLGGLVWLQLRAREERNG